MEKSRKATHYLPEVVIAANINFKKNLNAITPFLKQTNDVVRSTKEKTVFDVKELRTELNEALSDPSDEIKNYINNVQSFVDDQKERTNIIEQLKEQIVELSKKLTALLNRSMLDFKLQVEELKRVNEDLKQRTIQLEEEMASATKQAMNLHSSIQNPDAKGKSLSQLLGELANVLATQDSMKKEILLLKNKNKELETFTKFLNEKLKNMSTASTSNQNQVNKVRRLKIKLDKLLMGCTEQLDSIEESLTS
eukprot:TRINITY_DN8650_c0_g1_i2.p1 TRINITY_DN8650_c0_g1~~TRINITY_DN8650_c0_g1_i2.p1  ORF type:complete len:251 (+),score=44.99 TRINITY_DN8650_c0_g1_i2:319-1071(+)